MKSITIIALICLISLIYAGSPPASVVEYQKGKWAICDGSNKVIAQAEQPTAEAFASVQANAADAAAIKTACDAKPAVKRFKSRKHREAPAAAAAIVQFVAGKWAICDNSNKVLAQADQPKAEAFAAAQASAADATAIKTACDAAAKAAAPVKRFKSRKHRDAPAAAAIVQFVAGKWAICDNSNKVLAQADQPKAEAFAAAQASAADAAAIKTACDAAAKPAAAPVKRFKSRKHRDAPAAAAAAIVQFVAGKWAICDNSNKVLAQADQPKAEAFAAAQASAADAAAIKTACDAAAAKPVKRLSSRKHREAPAAAAAAIVQFVAGKWAICDNSNKVLVQADQPKAEAFANAQVSASDAGAISTACTNAVAPKKPSRFLKRRNHLKASITPAAPAAKIVQFVAGKWAICDESNKVIAQAEQPAAEAFAAAQVSAADAAAIKTACNPPASPAQKLHRLKRTNYLRRRRHNL